jgi:hypothetical protein
MSQETNFKALYEDFKLHEHEQPKLAHTFAALEADVTFRVSGKSFAEVCFALSGWPLSAEEEKECWAKLNEIEAERIRRDNRRLKGMNA